MLLPSSGRRREAPGTQMHKLRPAILVPSTASTCVHPTERELRLTGSQSRLLMSRHSKAVCRGLSKHLPFLKAQPTLCQKSL